MLIVTIANFFAIFLTFAGKLVRKEKIFFFIAIIFLIIFYSIRTDYGNDIPVYMEMFREISRYSLSNLPSLEIEWEPGWVVLNLLFAPFGWQTFLFFLTSIQFLTIYWLISKYVNSRYIWIIFAFYVLNANLLLTDLSMLRQALAMHIVAWSIPWILKNKFFKAGLLILLATTMHTSAYAAFILLLFPLIKNLSPKILATGFLIIFFCVYVSSNFVSNVFQFAFQSETFERYEAYSKNVSINGGIGLGVLLYIITAFSLLFIYTVKGKSLFFNYVFSLFVLTIPFSYVIPSVARIGLYFNLIGIVSLQNLLFQRKNILGLILLIMLFGFIIISYFNFFESPVWKPHFSIYHTIFD